MSEITFKDTLLNKNLQTKSTTFLHANANYFLMTR
jgi:hypothetical protein